MSDKEIQEKKDLSRSDQSSVNSFVRYIANGMLGDAALKNVLEFFVLEILRLTPKRDAIQCEYREWNASRKCLCRLLARSVFRFDVFSKRFTVRRRSAEFTNNIPVNPRRNSVRVISDTQPA